MDREYYLRQMVIAYLEAAAWSSTHTPDPADDSRVVPLDEVDADWSPEAHKRAEEDCAGFYDTNVADLEDMAPEQAGHDFWLTRCGHGCGFWDRGLGELGERLTKSAHVWGNMDPYVGDDGLIYFL